MSTNIFSSTSMSSSDTTCDSINPPRLTGNMKKDIAVLKRYDKKALLQFCEDDPVIFKLCNDDAVLNRIITTPTFSTPSSRC